MDASITDKSKKHIFIVGCKGIPARYGGFETFVGKLTEYRKDENVQYHVACIIDKSAREEKEFEYNQAHCFNINARNRGSSKAIFYDIDSINYSLDFVKKYGITDFVVYVLACRIGPFIGHLKKKIHKLGGVLYVNPDGHEWKRAKWSKPVRMYWKISERLMVKYADLLICDSKGIESYIQQDYAGYHPKTTYISYGAETDASTLKDDDDKVISWYRKWDITPKNYYLTVGRLVPENNFETMLREFMASSTSKDLVIITGYENVPLYDNLKEKLHFENDKRIRFVGTVYDQQHLKKIREDAYGYMHGHSVGGTNPSLLEAMGRTDLNLMFDVSFNKEVGEDGAVYWNKEKGNLAGLIEKCDRMSDEEIKELGDKAKKRIDQYYSWEYIRDRYEELWGKKEEEQWKRF